VCSGNVEIKPEDFEHPFSVELGPSAQVLSTEVAQVSPPDLAPKLNITEGHLIIEPLLLNPGDAFDITALVSDMQDDDHLHGRVAGVSSFGSLATSVTSSRWTYVFLVAIVAVGTVAGVAVGFATAGYFQ
jgi:hypothetical protein